MEHGFIDILKQLVAEQVNAILTDPKQFKSILADYTRNEYKKESRFLIQAVEAGVAKAIKETDDLPSCKKAKINELVEDYGLSPEVSAAIVDTLALVLRGDASKSVTPVQTAAVPSAPAIKGKKDFGKIGVWEGDLVNGEPEGEGIITKPDGTVMKMGFKNHKAYVIPDKPPKEKTASEKEADDLYEEACMLIGTDNEKAEKLFRKLAEMGNAFGMEGLGELYAAFYKDWAKAAEWYQKAADLGHEGSKKALDRLRKSGKI
jgi:TPR repeat protein